MKECLEGAVADGEGLWREGTRMREDPDVAREVRRGDGAGDKEEAAVDSVRGEMGGDLRVHSVALCGAFGIAAAANGGEAAANNADPTCHARSFRATLELGCTQTYLLFVCKRSRKWHPEKLSG